MSDASNVKQDELQLFFDEVNTAIQQLQKLVTDSTLFLTSYDLRTSQQVCACTVYSKCSTLISKTYGRSPMLHCTNIIGWLVVSMAMVTHVISGMCSSTSIKCTCRSEAIIFALLILLLLMKPLYECTSLV